MTSSMELRFKCANNIKCPGTHKTFSFLTVLEHLVSLHLNKEERSLLYDYVCSCGAGFVCRPLAISHMISLKDRNGHKLSRNNNFDPDSNNFSPELVEVCRKLTKDLVKNDVHLSDSILDRLKEEARDAVRLENEQKKRNDRSTMTEQLPVVEAMPHDQMEPSAGQETMDVEENDDSAMLSFSSTGISGSSSTESIYSTMSFASNSEIPSPPSVRNVVSSVPLPPGPSPPQAVPKIAPYAGIFKRDGHSAEPPRDRTNEQEPQKPQKIRAPDEQRIFKILNHFMNESHNLFEDVEKLAVNMFRGMSHCGIHLETLAAAAVVRAGHSFGFHIPHKDMRYFINVTVKQYDRVKTVLSHLFPFESLETLRPLPEPSKAPANLTNEKSMKESVKVRTPYEQRIFQILSHFMKESHNSFEDVEKKALELFNGVSNDVTDHEALAGAAIIRASSIFKVYLKHKNMLNFINVQGAAYSKARNAIAEFLTPSISTLPHSSESVGTRESRASSIFADHNCDTPLSCDVIEAEPQLYPRQRQQHCDETSPIMSPTYPPSRERSISSPIQVDTPDEERIYDILSRFMDQSHNSFKDVEKKALELFNRVSDDVTDHEALAGVSVVGAAEFFGISLQHKEMLSFINVAGEAYERARQEICQLLPPKSEVPVINTGSRPTDLRSTHSTSLNFDAPPPLGLRRVEAEPHLHQRQQQQHHSDETSPIMTPTYPPYRERSTSSGFFFQEIPRPHRPQATSSTAFPIRGPLHPLRRFNPYERRF